jgi:hypothetical protein
MRLLPSRLRGRLVLLGVGLALAAGLVWLLRSTPPPESPPPAPGKDPDLTDYVAEIEGGKLRIYLKTTDTGGRTLIRARPDGRTSLSDSERRALLAREPEATKLWQACKDRLAKADLARPEVEHDAWLQVAEQLEDRYRQDPEHLGVLRDLLTAYAQLLAFERNSGLGGNLCLLASRGLADFEARAAPLDAADQALCRHLRAWLLFVMRLYPAAEQAAAACAPDQAQKLRAALAALGQDRFLSLEDFRAGPLTVRAYRTLARPPDPDLLWAEVQFLVSRAEGGPPDGTVKYSLMRRGDAGDTQYFLYFHSLNQSYLVRLYRATPPPYPELRRQVSELVQAALVTPRKEKQP